MPFWVVSEVGRGMGVVIVEGKGQFWEVNLGLPIVTNEDALFPNYFERGLVYYGQICSGG